MVMIASDPAKRREPDEEDRGLEPDFKPLTADEARQWREKNPAAVALGSLGGRARASALSSEQRIAQSENAANSRWDKVKGRVRHT